MTDLNRLQTIQRRKIRRAMFRWRMKMVAVWGIYLLLSAAALWGMIHWFNAP